LEGRRLTLEAISVPLWDSSRRQGVKCLIGVTRDITERRRAEEALRAAEAKYRSIVDNAVEGIFQTSLEGKVLMANSALARILGFDSPEELMREMTDVARQSYVQPERRGEFQRLMEQQGIVSGFEYQAWRKDGGIVWVSETTRAVRDADGRVLFYEGILEDITARKQAVEELQRREEHYRRLLENITDVILILDAGGMIRYASPSIERGLGYDPAEVVGRQALEFVRPDERSRMAEKLRQVGEASHVPVPVEFPCRHRDGSWRITEAVGRQMPAAGGEPLTVVTLRDVTAGRQMEEQLRQSQKLEAIGQLSGGVAHDFNNLLTVIRGHADLLRLTTNLPHEVEEFVREVSAAADRAANLTRQLLTFSRRQTMQLADLDLNEVVANMTKMLRRILGEDIEMTLNYAAQPLPLRADAGMIEQVLLNLAVNARDAMPRGGRLTLMTESVDVTPAMLREHVRGRPGPFARLTVADNGTGIPPEAMPHIFEPFFTTKEVGKGTGLGLATVYGIVHQHDGWIEVESEVGRGTTFRIYLPRQARRAEPAAPAAAPELPRGTGETILLVEDDVLVQGVARKALETRGYRVLVASRGAEALRLWQEHRTEIRLLLTDMVMPGGMSGREIARRLLEENPRLRVIYMSGYSREIAGQDLPLQDGFNYLSKPFDIARLATAVRTSLDSTQTAFPFPLPPAGT
jgi:PAS domain S-box-containing protein